MTGVQTCALPIYSLVKEYQKKNPKVFAVNRNKYLEKVKQDPEKKAAYLAKTREQYHKRKARKQAQTSSVSVAEGETKQESVPESVPEPVPEPVPA